MLSTAWRIREACLKDSPEIAALIPLSVRGLQTAHYTLAQMEAALGPVFGVDYQLLEDGTYFVAEATPEANEGESRIIGCGGWSKREALYGGRSADTPAARLLDPATEPARIRAFFIHPDWARRGIGKAILQVSEAAAIAAGFCKGELCATLPGVPLYIAFGWLESHAYSVDLGKEIKLPVVSMEKSFSL